MNVIEYLLQQNRQFILNSKYQNTLYNGVPIREILKAKPVSKKSGPHFLKLLEKLSKYLLAFRYSNFIKYQHIYEKYQDLYLNVSIIPNRLHLAKIERLIYYLSKTNGINILLVDAHTKLSIDHFCDEYFGFYDKINDKYYSENHFINRWFSSLEDEEINNNIFNLMSKQFIIDTEESFNILEKENIEPYLKLKDELYNNNGLMDYKELYLTKNKEVVCPYCNSEYVAEIVYGHPPCFDAVLNGRRETLVGGDIITSASLSYKCSECGKGFKKYEI